MPEVEAVKPESSIDPGAPESAPEQTGVESAPTAPRGPDGWIPKVRFNEVVDERNDLRERAQNEREERVRLEERLKARETPVEIPKKAPTPQELDEMISRGDLTAMQATEFVTRVSEDRAVARALAIAEQRAARERRSQRRDSEMRAYAEAVPDILKKGSDVWKTAADNYQDIVFYNGEPDGEEQKLTYELMAVRTTLGSTRALKMRKDANNEARANRETYSEVGNGMQQKPESEEAKIRSLTPKQQEHFRRMEQAGRYPGGAKQYLEELNYERPSV